MVADGPLDPCRSGIHACRLSDLPYWLDDELWEVELHGRVAEHDRLVLAEAATVLRRIDAWDGGAAARFVEACVERVRDDAAAYLERRGLAAEAAELRDAPSGLLGAEAMALSVRLEDGPSEAVAFAADLSYLARGGRPGGVEPPPGGGGPTPGAIAANLAFVAAHALGQIATLRTGDVEAYETTAAAERERQQRWLAALVAPRPVTA